MRHLPSIEALTDADDTRLLAELEICQVLEKLARVRAIVDRADHILTTVLACGREAEAAEAVRTTLLDPEFSAAILASIRKA